MFSVVVTTKDREEFLTRAVNSIFASSEIPEDIVIVNDAGLPISKELFNSDEVEMKVINNKFSRGANYCRNLGVENCKNDIVFFIDDDDMVTRDSFLARLQIFHNNPEVGVCYTGIKIVTSLNLDDVVRTVLPYNSPDYLFDLLSKGNIIGSTSRAAIRKSYFYQAGRFDENLQCFQDYDLWIRMATVCKIASDNQSNVIYTVHADGGQISSKYKRYADSSHYLRRKYAKELDSLKLSRSFISKAYLRVAISAASSSLNAKVKYAMLSLLQRPSSKALTLILVPYWVLRRVHLFT